MSRFLLLFLLLSTHSLFAQSPALYMAPVWTNTPVPAVYIPYDIEHEPLAQQGATFPPVPGQYFSDYYIVLHQPKAKPVTRIQYLKTGLGDYLEADLHAFNPALEKFAGGPIAYDSILGHHWATYQVKKGLTHILPLHGPTPLKSFAHNSPAYSTADPALSPDCRRLYFAAQAPGGQGGWDIYYCDRTPDHQWSAPQNLGPEVNTPHDERYPSISPDGTLYFASKGYGDTTHFDLQAYAQGQRTLLPYPVNSKYDDLMLFESRHKQLWLTSNRPPIHSTQPSATPQLYRLTPKPSIQALVRQNRRQTPVADVQIYIKKAEDGDFPAQSLRSNAKGEFAFWLSPFQRYNLKFIAPGYDTLRKDLDFCTLGNNRTFDITEQRFCEIDLQVRYDNKPLTTPIYVAIYEKEVRIDSLLTDPQGRLRFDIRPEHPYRLVAYYPNLPPLEATAVSSTANRQYISKLINFTPPNGAYTRLSMIDRETMKGLPDVQVHVYQGKDKNTSFLPSVSDGQGNTAVTLSKDEHYIVLGIRPDKLGYTLLDTQSEAEQLDTLYPKLYLIDRKPGALLARFTRPDDPILLQAGKEEEMLAVLALLDEVPNLKIEILAHADPSEPKAQAITRDAAEFAADFFYLNGIARNRVQAKGLGGSQPIVRCEQCTPIQRQQNRRVEIKILQ